MEIGLRLGLLGMLGDSWIEDRGRHCAFASVPTYLLAT